MKILTEATKVGDIAKAAWVVTGGYGRLEVKFGEFEVEFVLEFGVGFVWGNILCRIWLPKVI